MRIFSLLVDVQLLAIVAAVGTLTLATRFQQRSINKLGSSLVAATWFSWTAVNAVSFVAQYKAGHSYVELAIPGAQLLSTLFLFGLTVWQMRGRKHSGLTISWVDYTVMFFCVSGVICWMASSNLYVAIGANVVANVVGLVPVLVQAWLFPQDIALRYWALRGASSVFAGLAFVSPSQLESAGFVPQATGVLIALLVGAFVIYKKLRARSSSYAGQPILATT